MTAEELIKELKQLPKTAKVFYVKDWEACNENGELTEVEEIRGVTSQRVVIDQGLDFEDVTEILLDV